MNGPGLVFAGVERKGDLRGYPASAVNLLWQSIAKTQYFQVAEHQPLP